MAENSRTDYIQLWDDIKKFFHLELEYVKFTAVQKMIIIFAAIAILTVIVILGGLALYFLSSALVYLIASWIGSTAGAYLIVSAILLTILLLILSMKEKLIISPIARFITKLFLDSNDD